MSVAKKEWAARGRFLMVRISKTNERAPEKKPLAGGVALVTGGSPGIGRAIAQQLALPGASVSICGPNLAAVEASARRLTKLRLPLPTQIPHVTHPPQPPPLD